MFLKKEGGLNLSTRILPETHIKNFSLLYDKIKQTKDKETESIYILLQIFNIISSGGNDISSSYLWTGSLVSFYQKHKDDIIYGTEKITE